MFLRDDLAIHPIRNAEGNETRSIVIGCCPQLCQQAVYSASLKKIDLANSTPDICAGCNAVATAFFFSRRFTLIQISISRSVRLSWFRHPLSADYLRLCKPHYHRLACSEPEIVEVDMSFCKCNSLITTVHSMLLAIPLFLPSFWIRSRC